MGPNWYWSMYKIFAVTQFIYANLDHFIVKKFFFKAYTTLRLTLVFVNCMITVCKVLRKKKCFQKLILFYCTFTVQYILVGEQSQCENVVR